MSLDPSELCKEVVRSVIKIQKQIDFLISPAIDIHFECLVDPELEERVLNLQSRIVQLGNLCLCNDSSDLPTSPTDFSFFVDRLEDRIERVNTLLEQERSARRHERNESLLKQRPLLANVTLPSAEEYVQQKVFHIVHALNIARPQLFFTDPIDNSNVPFRPSKLVFPKDNCTCQATGLVSADSGQGWQHPYLLELGAFAPPPTWLLGTQAEKLFPLLESTPLAIVDNEELFNDMLSRLKCESELAVDLENHSFRSFQGFTCIIQISSRSEDWIIDAIACRDWIPRLNSIFSDPHTLKVMHGAESDVKWLQRDFSCYLVGLFDTFLASKSLGGRNHALGSLVSHYCGVYLDKRFQLADWRIRPLPKEMIHYARQDTHYLLYIWDRLRNELAERSLLSSVFSSSRALCLLCYEKEIRTADSWRSLASKHPQVGQLSGQQMCVLKALYDWRDSIARQEDECVHFVMPKQMLFRLVEQFPESDSHLLSAAYYKPCPPLVKQHAQDLLLVIKEAIASADVSSHGDCRAGKSFRERFFKPTSDRLESQHKVVGSQAKIKAPRTHAIFSDSESEQEVGRAASLLKSLPPVPDTPIVEKPKPAPAPPKSDSSLFFLKEPSVKMEISQVIDSFKGKPVEPTQAIAEATGNFDYRGLYEQQQALPVDESKDFAPAPPSASRAPRPKIVRPRGAQGKSTSFTDC